MKIHEKLKAPLLFTATVFFALFMMAGCQTKVADKTEAVPQNNSAPAVTTAPAAAQTPQEKAPEDLKGFAEYTIKGQLGEKSLGGKDRIRKVELAGDEKESSVVIELNGNDAFSADMTVRGMLMDSKKLLEPLSKRQDVEQVSVSEYLDVDDFGGGKVEEWVFTLTMDRKGLDKVASGDFLLNDLTNLAVEYKIHPNFKR